MSDSTAPLSSLLEARRDLLRASWSSAVAAFSTRFLRFLERPQLYDHVEGLLLDLLAVVENPDLDGSGARSEISRIAEGLHQLQSREDIGTNELVFFLFSVKDILADALERATTAGAHAPEMHEVRRGLAQVGGLLDRLGLVLFESDVGERREVDLHQGALAMEYALLYERARRLAITDPLTGLYNFGYFRERLREERARAERYQRLLSLVLLDIDHFNDTQGHPAGNDVLRAIAKVLTDHAREVDIVARYGGEELVVVLPEATRREAAMMAERIRTTVAGLTLPGTEHQPDGRITVSAGVATFPVDAADDDELIERADQSLYRAKRAGRNRVVCHEPPHRERLVYRPYRPVSSVALVGSFNNWDHRYDPMVPLEDGAYAIEIRLSRGTYQYKFVLDGVEWIPDPGRSERTADGLGGENSVLRIAAGTPE
jgi:diguanylate cyclase (GGDEF)-like protein